MGENKMVTYKYNAKYAEYIDYLERVLQGASGNTLPASGLLGTVKPTTQDVQDAINRVRSYRQTHNGEDPPMVWFVKETTPTPTPTPIKLETYCPTQTMSYGNQNQCVIFLQQKLQDFGFYKYECDGVFKDETDKAVKAFQTATGHTADGIVGPKTWSSIMTYVAPKPGTIQGDDWVLATLSAKGNVGSEQGLRDLLASQGAYLYYYDQQQSQATTVNTLKGNCADLVNDLGLPYYRAKGFACRGVHCQVRCTDGKWYGHYILEYGPQGSKQFRDPAAWAKGKGLLELICSGGFEFLHYEGDYIP